MAARPAHLGYVYHHFVFMGILSSNTIVADVMIVTVIRSVSGGRPRQDLQSLAESVAWAAEQWRTCEYL